MQMLSSGVLIILDDDALELVDFNYNCLCWYQDRRSLKDSLDNPVIFQTAPSVTGLGTTNYAAYNYAVSGFCTGL